MLLSFRNPATSPKRSYDIHSRMLFHKNSRKADAYCDDAEHDLPCNILKAFAIPQGKHSGKRADNMERRTDIRVGVK